MDNGNCSGTLEGEKDPKRQKFDDQAVQKLVMFHFDDDKEMFLSNLDEEMSNLKALVSKMTQQMIKSFFPAFGCVGKHLIVQNIENNETFTISKKGSPGKHKNKLDSFFNSGILFNGRPKRLRITILTLPDNFNCWMCGFQSIGKFNPNQSILSGLCITENARPSQQVNNQNIGKPQKQVPYLEAEVGCYIELEIHQDQVYLTKMFNSVTNKSLLGSDEKILVITDIPSDFKFGFEIYREKASFEIKKLE